MIGVLDFITQSVNEWNGNSLSGLNFVPSKNQNQAHFPWLSSSIKKKQYFIKIYIPTTSKKPVWLFIGSVLIWHMYHPRSDSRRSLTFSCHVLNSEYVMPTRWFFVITWFWIVRMVWVSTRNHATWKKKQEIKNIERRPQITYKQKQLPQTGRRTSRWQKAYNNNHLAV